ncbi:site-specific integrase [Bacteroides thetaiotaomicron]|uniref:Site-specific integrase n=1 Tax=Bacteroides thetaiotaomicron TaxID=818 RepID=A0A7J5JHN9_BACT4|nr:site-specific integrase [Bacteroides thetaiotaomicron]
MKQVADGLQMEGNFGTAHVYKSSLNAIVAFRGKGDFTFDEVTPEWLKDFEVHLRSRGCSWNTVSTYLRTFRAVYNRAVDSRKADYVPHLFRSVYTGTRADRKRALDEEDMKKVFAKLPHSSVVTPALQRAQGLFVLMFLLRGLPFVDLAYLRKSDLRDNVITYRRRKTGRPLSVTLTPEAMNLLKKYMNPDSSSPYLFPLLNSREGTEAAYREYQLALRSFNQQLTLLGELLGLDDRLSSYTAKHHTISI